LARKGQVWYQNVQLEELNPMMYNTWEWGYGDPPYHEKNRATPLSAYKRYSFAKERPIFMD
jgi:hypothetical protein